MIRLVRWTNTLVLVGAFVSLPAVAQAYIGPGAGLSAIGSVLALLAAVLVAVFGFLWFPIKSYRRKRRQAAERARAGTGEMAEEKSAEK